MGFKWLTINSFSHLSVSACRAVVCYVLSLLYDSVCMLNYNVVADATLSLSMSMLHLKPQSVIRLHIVCAFLLSARLFVSVVVFFPAFS